MSKFSNLLSRINMCNLQRFVFENKMQTELLNIPLAVSWILACSPELAPNSIHTPSNRLKMLNIGIIWHQLKKKPE